MNNEEFKERLLKQNRFYNKTFTLEEKYKGLKYKILVKNKYGLCRILTSDLLYRNYQPKIQSALNKNEYFVNKAKEIHGDRYDYSESIYVNNKLKVIIKCKEHGEFLQSPDNHLRGKGCPKCGATNISKYQKGCPTGWNLINWENKAKNSNRFDSFKVYIIKIYDKYEEFYKIGRTFNSINDRFKYPGLLPYDFDIFKIYEGDAKDMFQLEIELKEKNKINKYIPNKKFGGMYECFKYIIL